MYETISNILGEGASATSIEICTVVAVCFTLGLLARAISKIFEI